MFGKNKKSQEPHKEDILIEFSDGLEDDNQTHERDAESQQTKKKKLSSDGKPLLSEIRVIEERPGGAKYWNCKHCGQNFTSTYTRIYNHFFGAPGGKKPGIQKCQKLSTNREEYMRLKQRVDEAESKGVSSSWRKSVLTKTQKPVTGKTIHEAFATVERDYVDQKIMRFLCANGIAFNALRSPEFHEMVSAINRGPKGYKAPSYERARTTLLDDCKRGVETELVPVKETWRQQGVSIISDGWSNVKQQPLINVLAENGRGAMFMYASDFSGVEKTGSAIAEFLLKAIDEVGPANVVQVVTDNASNCVAAGREIEQVHKHICWSPCVVHTANLMFKDFAKQFGWLGNTYKKGKTIVKYIVNHQQALAMFRANSKLELLKVAKTRFASPYITMKRILDCRDPLTSTVCLKKWREWVQKGDENSRKIGQLVATTVKDESFWEETENLIRIMKPIYKIIKFADGSGPLMGEIYERMDNMLGEVKDIMEQNRYSYEFPLMESIILNRWEKMNVSIHCLGFALNPRFYDSQYLLTPAPGGVPRRAPNMDKEVVTGVMKAFHKIAESPVEEAKLRDQFVTFHMRRGMFALASTQVDAVTMDPIGWWSTYGSETPELAEVALKVLSQPISSSSAERNWSTYKYIHSVVRNRLNCTRADKLVFIHSNLRLISRFSENYKDGAFAKWDIDPDNASLEDSTVRLEALKWKDLDIIDEENDSEGEEEIRMRKSAKGK